MAPRTSPIWEYYIDDPDNPTNAVMSFRLSSFLLFSRKIREFHFSSLFCRIRTFPVMYGTVGALYFSAGTGTLYSFDFANDACRGKH